jgi:hypothetical protein
VSEENYKKECKMNCVTLKINVSVVFTTHYGTSLTDVEVCLHVTKN